MVHLIVPMEAAQLRNEIDLIFNLCITKLGAVYILKTKYEKKN